MFASKTIDSEDLTIGKVFQSFYRVPDYQREYVWGEKDAQGERGDEVEQFLHDIFAEFEQATARDAPEYFIGTIVACEADDGVFDLIDGQQRTTTSYLTLCALRDSLKELKSEIPPTLADQISSSSTDWKGDTVHRMRLDLQYEDARNVLAEYGNGNGKSVPRHGTRSIQNLANAYDAIREFLADKFADDPQALRAFHGYFTNKVKLIRIQTPDVSRALKIFETINDRGVGLDAMDLLKNLLFMHAKADQFSKLKSEWKELTQELYDAGEKPLRFLRYYILADYDVKEAKLREEDIYNWLAGADKQTKHTSEPLAFAARLKAASKAYRQFSLGNNAAGTYEQGLHNTRAVGGSAIKQHYILLLAGRTLSGALFKRLCTGIEEVMCVWLIAGVPAKDYERVITQAARALRQVQTDEQFDQWFRQFIDGQKATYRDAFVSALQTLKTTDLRQFRLKYLIGKVAQYFDIQAYGAPGNERLADYLVSKNELEHVHAVGANEAARAEFGEEADDVDLIQSLGNLTLLEKSVNIVASNEPYSVKATVYPSSKFLLTRCQVTPLQVGVNDQITRAMARLNPAPTWSAQAIRARQSWYADIALHVWNVRDAKITPDAQLQDVSG